MKGIIWYYTTKEIGLNRFQLLVNEYNRLKINGNIKATSSNVSACFENGDTWIVLPARECARGHACNIALIERGTPERVVREVIMPCIKNFPYRAYNYY